MSVLLNYCMNTWAVSSYKTINAWTVRLYDVFLLYPPLPRTAHNATDTDLMLCIFSTLVLILRRQEGLGMFFYPSKSLCSLHFSASLSTRKGVKVFFYFVLSPP